MKIFKQNFSQKIVMLLVGSVAVTILFSFFFLHFLYKDLYINSIRESVQYQGQRTAAHYHYGELNEEIIQKIHWYNVVSEYEVIVVDNLEELTSTFPYQIGNKEFISEDDQRMLNAGNSVMKEGFVEEFQRQVIGAIFPINDGNTTIGYIYIYVPLAGLSQVFGNSLPVLSGTGLIFFIILSLIINRIRRSLFQPLNEIQMLSKEVSKGNYSHRLELAKHDEIGQMAKAFNEMSEALENQEERKKEFLSNVVHELRTPLTYIGGYTEALSKKLFTSPEEEKQYLLTIEQEVDRLNKLIFDLVELNNLRDELYHFEKEPIVIGQLLYDTCDLFLIHLSEKSISIQLDVDEELIVFNDPKRLQQIFYNVIDNAIKYSIGKGSIRITLRMRNGDFVFEVTNTGLSISTEDLDQIGERFFRTDKARNRGTGGTGLGLSIVKEIIRLQEGTFSITSNTAGEVKVSIVLPIN
ncbi:sensor histidine kinase [Jeotgalibacillus soli]|uniref:histidine kinase n=1 Tax=Jeotgalibacillus soli TaxID=889306 RepID=A0A0C2VRX2_9BACL|nr:HAMP domain-containing sensor histidine kinase [Jeotgalibacillus soli]KIL46743.1 histidine kinase [Jeotgalibacillus soli]